MYVCFPAAKISQKVFHHFSWMFMEGLAIDKGLWLITLWHTFLAWCRYNLERWHFSTHGGANRVAEANVLLALSTAKKARYLCRPFTLAVPCRKKSGIRTEMLAMAFSKRYKKMWFYFQMFFENNYVFCSQKDCGKTNKSRSFSLQDQLNCFQMMVRVTRELKSLKDTKN